MAFEFSSYYNRSGLVNYLKNNILPIDFEYEEKELEGFSGDAALQGVEWLGECGRDGNLQLHLFEIRHAQLHDARQVLTRAAHRAMTQLGAENALVAFVPQDGSGRYRLSLITRTIELRGDAKRVKGELYAPVRLSFLLGSKECPEAATWAFGQAKRVSTLEELRAIFSVESLTKKFYKELSDWYAWALQEVHFPLPEHRGRGDSKALQATRNQEALIRLLTRLIFVWFLKEKGMVPAKLFDKQWVMQELQGVTEENFDSGHREGRESRYYRAVLQNLFFATLSCPILDEKGEAFLRQFRDGHRYKNYLSKNQGVSVLMRYEKYFRDAEAFVKLMNGQVPFLNGGLFECLDVRDDACNMVDPVDAFSENVRVMRGLVVPDYLFLGEETQIDLSAYYGSNGQRNATVCGLIPLLKRYHFTTEENTPMEQEVALDPELLGRIFEELLANYNPETQRSARNSTGSFYTPREVVQYMVNEALVEWLSGRAEAMRDDLPDRLRGVLEYGGDASDFDEAEKRILIDALYGCRVLDPACGSGAFLMGTLQQMVHLLKVLDPDNAMWKERLRTGAEEEFRGLAGIESSAEREARFREIDRSFNLSLVDPDYPRKLYLIEHCIFGVDLQPIAVQIAKLRFFITLCIEQKKQGEARENFGIRALPNLETRFVAADTLGVHPAERRVVRQRNLIMTHKEYTELLTKIKETNRQLFYATTKEQKQRLRKHLEELQAQMVQLYEKSGEPVPKGWKLESWQEVSEFYSPTILQGVQGGTFDIIVGNPPYIQLQAERGRLAERYEQERYASFARTGDIYCLFYERGVQLLAERGVLCYITSNKWMRAGYGERLRSYLSQHARPLLLVDFAGVKVFESATVDTNILLLRAKGKQDGAWDGALETSRLAEGDGRRHGLLRARLAERQPSRVEVKGTPWVPLSPLEQSIKRKVEAVGTPLKEWPISIKRGVLTGCNEAFIISTEKREEILAGCADAGERERTERLIRPILRGRDLARYACRWAGLWLIATHNGTPDGLKRVDVNEYPSVKRHLDSFGDKLTKRTDMGDTPYNLRGCAYWQDFTKPKIIFPNMTKFMPFVYDNQGYVTNQKCFIITGRSEAFLTAFFNSSLFKYCFRNAFPMLQDGTRELSKIFFDGVSVFQIPSSEERQFQEAVKDIQHEYAKEKALRIDAMIFDLYRLSAEERAAIGYIEIE